MQENKQKFEVGDVVKLKESMWKGLNPAAYGFSLEGRYQVTCYKGGEYPSIAFNHSHALYDAAHFELVDPAKKKRFQIGDRVISTRDTPNVPEGYVGYVVEDDLLAKSGHGYAVRKEGSCDQVEYFNEDELELLSVANKPVPDAVNSPKHYSVFDDIEAIEIIARSMTKEMFKGYCFGNLLKYRLRAGGKDDVVQELGKANKYKELYEKYKEFCQ